jgi:hypothetical protein
VLDSHGDAVAKLQQHAQVLVGENQEVSCAAAAACSASAPSQPVPEQVKAAAIIPPLVGAPDSYKQLYENAVEELNKRGAPHLSRVSPCLRSCVSCLPSATDEAARLRAAMRMQGEEDVAKFRHVLLRELAAERERLQRVLDSKVQSVFVVLASELL